MSTLSFLTPPVGLMWQQQHDAFATRQNVFLPRPSPRPNPHYNHCTSLYLNRFLFDPSEVDTSGEFPSVTIAVDDYRTVHAAKVLGVQNGEVVYRAGIVGTGLTDEATVTWIPSGKIKKAEPTQNGGPPGPLRLSLRNMIPASDGGAGPRCVSLILACPRPLALRRILPVVSMMGVDRLVLCGASKVPKDYFGSHLFRKEEEITKLLVEGLCQAGDVRLPEVTVARRLKIFLEDDLDDIFPPPERGGPTRVIAHPTRSGISKEKGGKIEMRVRDVELYAPSPMGSNDSSHHPSILLAVGPEGGWEEEYEIDLFRKHGFEVVTLGQRTLRTDVAVITLLGLAQDACDSVVKLIAGMKNTSL
eukprot:CAMPEP_0113308712 /NCGR_PEP_ID=MMETSP0010_2-20120614/7050_1 /TAXON_ID=216773 ORGANISM="Corethron hystrix, Strain 308" /NCGR_SAMPLE_ID=MMETSP0010_2 /ASSEMBLY_ACC=CAM_ASM_000155 /LENGTH=359 /DNA_ID=CAMNT_0000163827 /DNA_START=241 /DNA_END=1320 /DNA_ORIENTATION=- /assembly_acc=CAM_ASM_000155